MRPLLLQIPFGKLKAYETGRSCTIRGPGNELETCVLRETDQYDHTKNFVCLTVNYQRTSLQIKKKIWKVDSFKINEKVKIKYKLIMKKTAFQRY